MRRPINITTTLLIATLLSMIVALFSRSPIALADPAGDTPVAVTTDVVQPNAEAPEFTLYLPLLQSPGTSVPVSVVNGQSRGYLITPQELRAIKGKAEAGIEPYARNLREMLASTNLDEANDWVDQETINGRPYCSDGSQRDPSGNKLSRGPDYLIDGSRLAYAKGMVAILSPEATGSAYARFLRERILDLTDTSDWGGNDLSADNQCVLYLSWYITGFVMTADLLEEFPTVWTASDKQEFQSWLANEVYPKAAWASRARTNNWGSGGSYAAAMIADYLHDSELMLEERSPRSLRLTPGQAYAAHTAEQLSRMSTDVTHRDREDSQCLPYKGIQPSGGIPDELRRATIANPLSLCDAEFLPSISGSYKKAYAYQQTHIEPLIAHAELALRRGDARLYDNVAEDGSGSILQAIKFLIDNPRLSYDWDESRIAQLFVAYRYYRDPALLRQLKRQAETLRAGEVITYAQVTHSFAEGETPPAPPVVAAPAD